MDYGHLIIKQANIFAKLAGDPAFYELLEQTKVSPEELHAIKRFFAQVDSFNRVLEPTLKYIVEANEILNEFVIRSKGIDTYSGPFKNAYIPMIEQYVNNTFSLLKELDSVEFLIDRYQTYLSDYVKTEAKINELTELLEQPYLPTDRVKVFSEQLAQKQFFFKILKERNIEQQLKKLIEKKRNINEQLKSEFQENIQNIREASKFTPEYKVVETTTDLEKEIKTKPNDAEIGRAHV